MNDFSFISNAHPNFLDSLYEQYQQNPELVEASWRHFFKGYDYASEGNGYATNGTTTAVSSEKILKELRVLALIFAYRNRGHLLSTTNPLKPRRDRNPKLALQDFGLTEAELDTPFVAGKEIGMENATLRQIIDRLKYVYCGNIGFQFQHIQDRDTRRWLRTRIESLITDNGFGYSAEKKRRILEKLNGAVAFEEFLHTKFVGQKRFSLEGGENTIVALDAIINKATDGGVDEVVIGMAHRGRLNVLANTLGKTYEQIFKEFEGDMPENMSFGDGDVKYHLGFSSQVTTATGKTIYLKLVPNPSHLEAVNPVVEGFARAKADILYKSDYDRILPILIHGDAAIAGQGIVYEVAQMSKLKGYYTGGTIHFVTNNQVGFTTDFDDARSSTYCTGVASVIQAPAFHVNGDDAEAVQFVAELAVEYRQQFNSDVFIDMVCYRKHGHNEGDDPEFTQPEMYKLIKNHKNPREVYSEILVQRGDVDKDLAHEMETAFKQFLQERLDEVKQHPLKYEYQESEQAWRQLKRPHEIKPEDFDTSPATGIDRAIIDKILNHLVTLPESFHPLPKVNRLLKATKEKIEQGKLDWALGELMAYGSILLEGRDVRMSGQDVKRGTFSHRHSVLQDVENYQEYIRLDGMSETQGKFRIFNSLLSEFGVMGFEYGYSLASPNSMVIWEAQFGDFYNGAQTIVDQFITAGESKWQRMSGLVLLLPHGYEGQGPEHSSARLERFLQNCAEYNMTIANVTTPVNFFHLLRRQLARPFRKPLVVMSPKSLLRHPECVSNPEDFETGKAFQEIYDDANIKDAKKVKRVLFCTGKVYYDLLQEQREKARQDVAIVRIEQLYPFPEKQINTILEKYAQAELFWVQEEPANMGAWQYLHRFDFRKNLTLVSRKASASPATGFKKKHDKEQAELVEKSFA
ncbi:MAG: 2-oxoglutarate dehydrogenase E1 component [Saprospiraceae bacterium]|nr:2-oxoglutarate dehydrogenase E1 component [Saprospiraceae bacterium]